MSRKADLPDARPSGKIAGYLLDRCIGQSDTATVYLARDEHLDRQVALKVLAPELAAETTFRSRLLRESRAAAALGHPHIVPVYEANDAAGILYVAMRYIPGGDCRSLLSRDGPLPLAATWNIISQTASALDAAHAGGLVHRDVKPANILFEGDYVYLADFGMGTDTSANEPRTAGQLAGMFDYAAPEQVEGLPPDGRADLYSLACAGFELLCGTPLFEQDHGLTVMYAQLYVPPPSATTRRHELPPAVDRVLATALAKDPADRYATCGQFAQELAEALGLASSRPVAARPRPSDHGAGGTESAPVPGPPTMSKPAVSQPAVSQPAPGREPASGAGGPRWRRHGVVTLVLAAAAAAIIAAVITILVTAKKPAPHAAAPARPVATSAPSPTSSPTLSATPTPSPAALASGQAAAVAHLLNSSAATRQALHGAVNDVATCTSLSSAAGQIQSAVNQRSTEYSQASALSVSALANGAVVKSDLVAALRTSLAADKDYLTWAQQQLTQGCAAPAQSSAYSVAFNADQTANTAKAAFVAVWNPVAAKYGVPQKSADSI